MARPVFRMSHYTAAHWGVYRVARDGAGAPSLEPFERDPDPSPIGFGMLSTSRSELRIRRPAVRRSWLAGGIGARPDRRGGDAFVEVSWDEALDLAAAALRDVIERRGNGAIFGGSYGWSSAGRFHHAQSQIHRFLNAAGGYVRHADTYSLGAGRVLMPHIVAPMDELMAGHTTWDVMAAHTQLFVAFGGVALKNTQVSSGMVGSHNVKGGLSAMARAGTRFINISPVNDDLQTGGPHEWIPIRPNTDTALLLAVAFTLHEQGLHDAAFLDTYCTGFDRFVPYLTGAEDGTPKTPEWASAITAVPAERIRRLAHELAGQRSMLNMAWALQRAHHGEQPFWALVTVACMLGQVGLPGGGFGVGYGAANSLGNATARFKGPTLPQGTNRVAAFIPVARIADMLERPGDTFRYNGASHRYPDIELIHWAGGNPFHHHQDLHRLLRAWKRPKAVIVHEQFWTPTAKAADIVLPATTTLERDDIGYSSNERYLVAMRKVQDPVGEARDDYAILADIASRLGVAEAFTEGRDAWAWVRHLYDSARTNAEAAGVALPDFEAFWEQGVIDLCPQPRPHVMLGAFRRDPRSHALSTPSGRIEIFSERIAGFGEPDCAGHARWYEPAEWLGGEACERFPLHLISDQPFTKLHSQLDHAPLSRGSKIAQREPVTVHPDDAAERGIGEGDIVRLWNARGSCFAGARLSTEIRRGVVRVSTGSWFDPVDWRGVDAVDKHGNPNAVTLDIGTSGLSQGCSAQTCLVQLEKARHPVPPVTAHGLPRFEGRPGAG